MRAALVLIIYALAMLCAGLYAFTAAPEGANAKTALIVPGACAALMMLLAFGVLLVRKARVLLHVSALILMLIFAGAFSIRAMDASGAVRAHRNAAAQLDAAIEEGEVDDTPEARAAFYEQEGAPDHDKSYLALTLWGLVVMSALALVAGIANPPKRAKKEEPTEGS